MPVTPTPSSPSSPSEDSTSRPALPPELKAEIRRLLAAALIADVRADGDVVDDGEQP